MISYLKEDIFQYLNNLGKLMEKLLLLEKTDFTSTRNSKLITKIAPNHEKSNQSGYEPLNLENGLLQRQADFHPEI